MPIFSSISTVGALLEDLRYLRHSWTHRLSRDNSILPPTLVIGAPKTGTTWLFRLLSDLPQFKSGGHLDLQQGTAKLEPGRVYHSHVRATEASISALETSGAKPILIIRDLRDQCVSRAFHIQRQPTNDAHRQVSRLPFPELLKAAILGWPTYAFHGVATSARFSQKWMSTRKTINVRYEDLLEEPARELERVFAWLKLEVPTELARVIIERNRFERVSGGIRPWRRRPAGQEDKNSFFRKGIAGDWRNYFTPEHVSLVKELAGEALIDLGYEEDLNWNL